MRLSNTKMRTNKHASTLGGKLGPRVAAVVGRAMHDHLRSTARVRSKIHADGLNEFHRQMGKEIQQHISPLLQVYADGLPDGDPLKDVLQFMAAAPGEASVLSTLLAVGPAVGQGMLSSLQNALAPTNQTLIQLAPSFLIAPNVAAGLVVAGLLDEATGKQIAAMQGFGDDPWAQMKHAATTYLNVSDILEVVRRSLNLGTDPATALQRQGVPADQVDIYLELARQLLSPADAALAVLRGIIPLDDGYTIANMNGMTNTDFDTLIGNTGEPPGAEELMFAWRRNIIGQADFDRGIKQSRIRDEWIPTMEQLRYSPMSTADAVRAVIENYLGDADGQTIAEQNGLDPDHWVYLRESWGRPLSHEQMMTLYYRGQATIDEVQQAFRESDLKDKYIDKAVQLGVRYPPLFEVRAIIAAGGLTDQQGTDLLLAEGYTQEVAAGTVKAAHHTASASTKALARGDILTMYADAVLTEAEATTHLTTLGYSAADVTLYIRLEDAKLEARVVTAGISSVHTQYDHGHLDETSARNELAAIGVSPTQINAHMAVWVATRAIPSKTLTAAQIVKGAKNGSLAPSDALGRLVGLGYTQVDASILMTIEGVPEG